MQLARFAEGVQAGAFKARAHAGVVLVPDGTEGPSPRVGDGRDSAGDTRRREVGSERAVV